MSRQSQSSSQGGTQSKQTEPEDDNCSINSDISVNTNSKVFNGAFNTMNQFVKYEQKSKKVNGPAKKEKLSYDMEATKASNQKQIKTDKYSEVKKEIIPMQSNDVINIKNSKMPSPYSFRLGASQIFDSMKDELKTKNPGIFQETQNKEEINQPQEKQSSAHVIKNLIDCNSTFGNDPLSSSYQDNIITKQNLNGETFKSNSSSQFNCTLSKIDKGLAYFVTSDNVIFSMPSCLLPATVQPGCSYQFNLNESMKSQYKINTIQKIHKKLLESSKKSK